MQWEYGQIILFQSLIEMVQGWVWALWGCVHYVLIQCSPFNLSCSRSFQLDLSIFPLVLLILIMCLEYIFPILDVIHLSSMSIIFSLIVKLFTPSICHLIWDKIKKYSISFRVFQCLVFRWNVSSLQYFFSLPIF